ncbi:MAG: T9SS type A sorting domain-containing protein [Ignavibacteriales bacterium]|nr:T9SS type A sorting domain-containing protein [Ignavibacteriales bacterium]
MVDAWGNMTMPGGAVLQALRVRSDDIYTSPSPPFYRRVISYSFITKSGASIDVTAIDTTAPNNGIISTEGVTWRNVGPVSVENQELIPTKFYLSQNYPNPFNPNTIIQYAIGSREFVQLKVYDVLGIEVATLVNEEKPAGNYEINFNASQLSSGIYFYKLQAGSFVKIKKLILIK